MHFALRSVHYLARAQVAVRRGQRGIHLGLPPGTRYTTDAAIATVLGPRDDAWLDAAIADLSRAIEIDPACWSAYHHRGMVYSVQGDQDASFRDYLKARKLRGEP